MDNLQKILSVIFYLIWILLGLLLFAGIIFIIVANPIGSLLESSPFGAGGGPGGGQFGPPEGGQSQGPPGR